MLFSSRQGTIAYVSQQAWIQNLTFRDNILFGQDMNMNKYKKIIQSCALKSDLHTLIHGDATEIGENGINLSGGQKQRVNLARAVYQDADIYILDDPLSAVDVHVGKHIFENVISNGSGSLLAKKTRIWVTNNLSYLPFVDNIILLDNGRIIAQGSYQQLMTTCSRLKQLVDSTNGNKDTQNNEQQPQINPEGTDGNDQELMLKNEDFTPGLLQDAKLIQDESVELGSVKFSVYLKYFQNIGYCSMFMFYGLVCASKVIFLFGNVWLSKWSDDNVANKKQNNSDEKIDTSDEEFSSLYYLAVYAILGVSGAIIKLSNDLKYYYNCAMASRSMHKNLLNNVMRSPMAFFDTNPSGRIVNRFTSDMDSLDQSIPFSLLDFSECTVDFTCVIILISVTTPAFVAVIIPLLIVYYFLQKVYISSSRQLKRLNSISKSPIFSHFAETTCGVSVIRAYGQEQRFIQESQDKVYQNVQSFYLNVMSNRWLGMRLENIGNCAAFFASLFAIFYKDSLTGGQAGLSITSAIGITG